jgi:hypothetical protein
MLIQLMDTNWWALVVSSIRVLEDPVHFGCHSGIGSRLSWCTTNVEGNYPHQGSPTIDGDC